MDKGWQKKRGWKCPVIIDNMMNLELLFEASLFSGDSTYYNIATKHANVTLANHFREDNSSYHVVDYDPEVVMCVADKPHKDILMHLHGHVDRLGGCMAIQSVIDIQRITNTLNKREK